MKIKIIGWSQYKYLKHNNNNSEDTVYLCDDSWNDFGYYTAFRISYVDKSNKLHDLEKISIGQIDEDNKITNFSDTQYNCLPINYISLGGKTYYEKLNNILELEDIRKTYFESMNDMAYNLKLYNENSSNEMVKTSLLRGTDSIELERLLHKMAKDGLSMYAEFSWEYIYNSNDVISFNVNPKEIIPNNIFVIIGENQAGKTTILNNIFSKLSVQPEKSDSISTISQLEYKEVYLIRNSTLDNNKCSEVNKDNYFLIENLESLKRTDLLNQVKNRLINKDKDLYCDIFKIVQNKINSETISSLFIMIFDKFSPDKQQEYSNLSETKREDDNDLFETEIEGLSSGNKVIFYTLMLVIAKAEYDSIFLLDEPESHLHPSLQVGFIRVLKEILQKLNGMAIIATHSPLFLQCIPSKNVSIMSREENHIFINSPKIETFGASFGELFNEVLAVDTIHSVYGDVVDDILKNEEVEKQNNIEQSHIWEKYGNKLGSLASMKLLREIQ